MKKERPQNKYLMPPPVKGEIRNPKGKPKGTRNRSTIIKEFLDAKLNEDFKLTNVEYRGELTVADQMAAAIILQALDGNVNAFRELMDSAYGKVPDVVIQKDAAKALPRKFDNPEEAAKFAKEWRESLK